MKDKGILLLFSKSRIEYIVPAIHFILSFLYERIIFFFDGNTELFTMAVRNPSFFMDARMEIVMTYILSKLTTGIIIFYFWKLIFSIINKRIPWEIFRLFLIVFIIGGIAGCILFPEAFGTNVDNYGVYKSALYFKPNYWQSIYTGVFYAGCMMFFPSPIAIFFVQWLCLNCTIALLFFLIQRYSKFNDKRYGYLVVALYFLPET